MVELDNKLLVLKT